MKRNRLFIIIIAGMFGLYGIAMVAFKIITKTDNTPPTLTVSSDMLTVSVKQESKLLKGVKAYDEEDGDLTKDVFIYSLSQFDENHTRTITYGVFDSQGELATVSRQIQYNDYVAPRFEATKSLMNLYQNYLGDAGNLRAISSVDGDISSRISSTYKENATGYLYTYTVTDSTGTTSSLSIEDETSFSSLISTIDIKLSDYVVYLKVGEEVNWRDYIEEIQTPGGRDYYLAQFVDIQDDVNMDEPGQYDVKYSITRSNGDRGVAKLIVVVE